MKIHFAMTLSVAVLTSMALVRAETPAAERPTTLLQAGQDDGQKNQKDDGQKNQKDDGQKNQKDDGQQNQKDDGQQNQKDDGQQNQGVVKAVDPARNRITLTVARQGKPFDQIMTLPKNVPVVIGGKAGTVADLKPGMRVGLSLSKDRKAVVRITEAPANVGQKNQKDDGQKNQKDDGQKNQKNDGQKNQKNGGQQNQKNDGQKNQKDDGQQNQKNKGQ